MIARFKPYARVSAVLFAATISAATISTVSNAQPPRYADEPVPHNSLRQRTQAIQTGAGTEDILFMPLNPNPPHLVLEAPRPQGGNDAYAVEHGPNEGNMAIDPGVVNQTQAPSAHAAHGTGPIDHLKNQFLHADKREAPVAIPNANRMPVWKTPYSYGHFGASRNRQWSLHRGQKDSYMQWSLR